MPIRVLLAEDHTIVRDGLASLLRSASDITVVGEAADGRQAVEEARRLKPDVVVMDIAMPELNGIEATRHISQACPETRVLILSVYSTIDHINLALKAGARGYLLKGAAASEMVHAIRAVHTGCYYLAQNIMNAVIGDYLHDHKQPQGETPFSSLTSREREIAQMVVDGKSNSEIAEALGLAITSVGIYKSRLLRKLGAKDVASLVKMAIQHGLTAL